MTQIAVLEAYSRLKSLRQNAPEYDIGHAYVDEFHGVLDLLEKASGVQLTNFRIPRTMVKPVITGRNTITEKIDYSDEEYCDRNFFLMKVDGALTMFELLGQRAPEETAAPVIGFRPH